MADSKPAALATAAAVPFPTIVERVRPHAKLIGLLALGHFAVDLTQGSLPAVLPFLKSAHGGNVGIALGPLVATFLVTTWALQGTLALALPPLLVGAVLLAALPSFTTATTAARATKATGRGENMPAAMALLILVVMIRASASLGFTTFMPFYYVDYLEGDPRIVGPLLFVFLGAGALGTVLVSPL